MKLLQWTGLQCVHLDQFEMNELNPKKKQMQHACNYVS